MTVQGLIDKLLEYDPEDWIDNLEVDMYGIIAISIIKKEQYNDV